MGVNDDQPGSGHLKLVIRAYRLTEIEAALDHAMRTHALPTRGHALHHLARTYLEANREVEPQNQHGAT